MRCWKMSFMHPCAIFNFNFELIHVLYWSNSSYSICSTLPAHLILRIMAINFPLLSKTEGICKGWLFNSSLTLLLSELFCQLNHQRCTIKWLLVPTSIWSGVFDEAVAKQGSKQTQMYLGPLKAVFWMALK